MTTTYPKTPTAPSSPDLMASTPTTVPDRLLDEKDCATWGIKRTAKGNLIFEYRDLTGALVGQKAKKEETKAFRTYGKVEGFFGWHKWASGGKRVTITEGELDCASWSKIDSHKWPTLSLAHGAKSAPDQFKKHLDYLQLWDEVVLMFDNDEHGREAADGCAEILMNAGISVKVVRVPDPHKDPSDCLVHRATAGLKKAFWDAQEYRPEGIKSFEELEAEMADFKVPEGFPWFHPDLQAATRGRRPGEISLITAPPKVGKTEFTRAQCLFDAQQGRKVGLVRLEEAGWRSFFGDVGMAMGQRLHIEGKNPIGSPEYEEVAKTLRGQMYYYNHRGSLASDALFSKMTYLTLGVGCEIILLDHITIAVSGLDIQDERKALDVFLTKLVEMAQRTHAHLMVICHVKKGVERVDGWDHLNLESFRGTGGFAQLTDTMIGLEQNHEDEKLKDVRRIRVIADRWLNDTGIKGHMKYSRDKGVLVPCEAEGMEW